MPKRSSTKKRAPTKTKTAGRVASLPTVTAEKVLEAKSRAILKESMSPWLVTDWLEHDYGIDAIVEVTRARSVVDNFDATSKRFAVQLKATEERLSGRESFSVRVRPDQIRYWTESTEPVLLVLCHVPTRTLHWRWIDHSVVEELSKRDPSWIGQQTVSIAVSMARVLDMAGMQEVASLVFAFRSSSRRVLAPGVYVDIQARLSAAAAELTAQARSARFKSVIKRLEDLEAAVRASTYIVALTGPARAGKSTLLNTLVGREVSPVGRLPTTAVSLLVTAGARDQAEVLFGDDRRICGAASVSFLEDYATIEKNPDNRKGVRLVTVRLVNELLERGVAYADAPGLHDPSADIRSVTETALRSAHAVLYVLDVSPAKHGGFSVSEHHIRDLTRLREMAERLFIVMNKADVLSSSEQQEVARYMEQTLRKYAIWDALPMPPVFISAATAWDWHGRGRNGPSPIAALEDAIWTHLLRTNSTGMDRLATVLSELRRAGSDFASLLATRRITGVEAARLRRSLDSCREREGQLVAACRKRALEDERFVRESLTRQCAALLAELQRRLELVPIESDLPPHAETERDLQMQVARLLSDTWREASARFQTFASYIGKEVEQSLEQARMATGANDQVRFVLPQVPALNVAEDSFQEAWTGLFTGGFFGYLLGGPWALALAAGGWLAGAILGRDRRRKREIARVVSHARKSLTTALDGVFSQVREKIHIYQRSLEQHVVDRISVFVHDVEKQLRKLGEPVTENEQLRLAAHERAVQATLTTLISACSEIGFAGGDATVPGAMR